MCLIWSILILTVITPTVNAITVNPQYPVKYGTLTLTATATGSTLTWLKDTQTLTPCLVSAGLCSFSKPSIMNNSVITIDSGTSVSTISISNATQTLNGGLYAATNAISKTVIVSTLPSSVQWESQPVNGSSLATGKWIAKTPCVFPEANIIVDFTIYVDGIFHSMQRVLTYSESDACEFPEKEVLAQLILDSSSYSNQRVYIIANASHNLFPNEPYVESNPSNEVIFKGQSTDSCEFNYGNCIWYILAAVYMSSGSCTVVVVVWWKTKRKEIKVKSIICWLAEHRFCCCVQKIKSFIETYKNTRFYGARVLLLADLFVTGMVLSLVVWLFAVFIVIFACCACKEWQEKLTVAGISLGVSLVASAIWTAIVLIFYLIASCCKNNGCVCKPDNRITKEAGDDINFLEQRPHEFKRIKSIDLKKDGIPVSPDEYEVKMTSVPSLILKMVSLDQSGKYECTISYDLTKKKVHQLNLLVTPKQYEVKMGDRKTLLKCLRNLNGIEDVKWTLNNNAIPADSLFYKGGTKSNPSLTVKYCSTSDSGLYICSIRTTKSSKRFSAQLKTREKYTVGTGKSIEFLKDLSSCRDISLISWELNGNPLELVDNPSYNGGTIESPVFTVNCATKEESGKYKCTLMLESLPTKELKFTLYLNEQLQVDSGESIALLDQLGNSNNASSVEWTHKKRPLTCFHKGGTIECPALTIPVVSHEDSGEYNCKITLKQGNKRFYRFVVNVNVQKIKKKVGDRVVLLQNLKSAGTIQEIDWYKNGQKVQAGKDEKYQGGINQSPSLSVGSLQEHDSGLYECDLIVKESQIKLHILVDLTVEQKENFTRLRPVIGHNRVHNHETAENNQS